MCTYKHKPVLHYLKMYVVEVDMSQMKIYIYIGAQARTRIGIIYGSFAKIVCQKNLRG